MWVKSFVAPQESACNLRNLMLQSCDPVIQFWHLKKKKHLDLLATLLHCPSRLLAVLLRWSVSASFQKMCRNTEEMTALIEICVRMNI